MTTRNDVDPLRRTSIEPPVARRVPEIARYDTVNLGFPIWGGTAPPVIRSFLAAHDLAGKILVPFIMQADQERRTMEQVSDWLRVPGR